MPVLNSTVIVRDDNFVTHVFLSGDEPPSWAVEKITNPDVWANAPDRGKSKPEPVAPSVESAPSVKIPPKAGRGSSAKAWSEYAASNGFEVDGDATASEIRDALQEHGIPTE